MPAGDQLLQASEDREVRRVASLPRASRRSCKGSVQHLVAILRDPDDMIPMVKNGVTEERPLLYVAITRAKDDLHLIVPQRSSRMARTRGGAGMFTDRLLNLSTRRRVR